MVKFGNITKTTLLFIRLKLTFNEIFPLTLIPVIMKTWTGTERQWAFCWDVFFMRLIIEWNLAETEVSDWTARGEFPSVSQYESSSIETSQKICYCTQFVFKRKKLTWK